jgi:hypothetical protein
VSSQWYGEKPASDALVGEPDFEGDRGQRLSGAPHQGLGPLDPPFGDVALGTEADRLFERAAEVIGAETCDVGEQMDSPPRR